jgi:hypothetical protein
MHAALSALPWPIFQQVQPGCRIRSAGAIAGSEQRKAPLTKIPLPAD